VIGARQALLEAIAFGDGPRVTPNERLRAAEPLATMERVTVPRWPLDVVSSIPPR
jgi:hypothetical protein